MQLSRATSTRISEAGDHYTDHAEDDVAYPSDALLRRLVIAYIEQHSDDFSKKEPIEDGGPAHWVYLKRDTTTDDTGDSKADSDNDTKTNKDGYETDGKMTISLSMGDGDD